MSSKDRPGRELQPPGDCPAAKPQAPDVRPFERLIRAIAKTALGLSASALLASLATIVYSVVRRYASLGADVPPREEQTPEGLAALHQAEVVRWHPIIKAAGIKVD